ncbi:Arylsulfatase [Maioricimonas rarisocia]|uniref:Arylsulfatase n=1 Tax=Maioricimonas rarisocia TaxID=2528026 RepID=A0A517Z770_9PLAN|nr:arylsulfatase [Maioricimonas rarisocia]QDU38294.1 Arylsulfatase [Maioricimonas rarisocia]
MRSTPLRIALSLLIAAAVLSAGIAHAERPNIVVILADDMGYGDPGCYNAESKCPTPHIDRLASQGMRFTDAHTAGSVCVPSRYGLLTGRYPFRTKLDWRRNGVIEKGRTTVASLLQENGYATAMVGKWHLGFDGGPDYDWSQPMRGGPVHRGFATYFGMPASLDIPPYYYIRGRQPVYPPTETIEASATEGWSPIQGAFWREGKVAPDFRHDEVLDRFASEAVKVVEQRAAGEQPFFLYLALTAPHTPWLPAEEFRGKGAAGLYSEFVAHVDDVVGRVLRALEDSGAADETLVLFASDNGPVWYDEDEERFGHESVGPLRGMKGDAWDGGHRVPFVVRWPGHVEAGSTSDALVGFVDLFATVADIVDADVPADAAEDSVSFHSVLQGEASVGRQTMVQHHSGTVLRDGKWKLINHLGSGGFSKPRREQPQPGGPQGQLYNLAADPGEQNNLWQSEPERVKRMLAELKAIRAGER